MKKILLLTTGGTIASAISKNGLIPSLDSKDILSYLRDSYEKYIFDHENLLDLDSSNIQPEEWRIMAQRIFAALPDYDGIILTHGTDTMAYTASALSFMLQNINIPVVITGSQLPITSPLTDATTNLYTAVEAIEHNIIGISVAFNRKVIAGTRAVKVSTMGFNAFESLNAPYLAEIFADGTRVYPKKPIISALPFLKDTLCTDVFILKLLPGTKPEIFDALLAMNYRGIVIESFGAGGIHYLHRDLISKLGELVNAGVTILVCSQCLYERCDLSIYEVGQKMLAQGVISGQDMSTEAAATKLMWVLGQTKEREHIEAYFKKSIVGEITFSTE